MLTKYIFLLSLLCPSIVVFSQEYQFDYFIQKNTERIKPDKKKWIEEFFYDSSCQNTLSLRTENGKITASLYDEENDRRHVYKVNKVKDRLTFIYKYTNQFPQQHTAIDDKENVIKIERIDSLKYSISVFKNSKLKKKKISAIITLKKSDLNYIDFNADYSRTDEINEKIQSLLSPELKYQITFSQIKYHFSGYNLEESIQKIQKTNLTITVPEKLTFTEFDYWSDFEE